MTDRFVLFPGLVTERTDSGGAGKLSGDGIHGRIYRIWWEGTQDVPGIALRPMHSWQKIRNLSDEKLDILRQEWSGT